MPWLASHRFYRSRSPTPGPCDALPRAHAHQLVVRVRRHHPKPDPRELPIAVDPRVLAPVPPLRPRTPIRMVPNEVRNSHWCRCHVPSLMAWSPSTWITGELKHIRVVRVAVGAALPVPVGQAANVPVVQ